MKNMRTTFFIGLALALCIALPALAREESKTLSRIAVIGASMSDGFGVRVSTTLPDGKKISEGVNFAELVKTSCKDPSVVVVNYTSSLYFMNPARIAKSSAARACGANAQEMPTCVLAVDWLFWNGYGTSNMKGEKLSTDQERMELLDNALACLEPFCAANIPVVLGDFPDMHSAIGGGMISAPMVPSVECLAALNKRVAQWALTKKNVCVVPLAQLTQDLLQKTTIHAAGREWDAKTLGPMLQKDRLHPTFAGTVTVLAATLDALNTKTDNAALKSFEIDPAVLRERFVTQLKASATKTDDVVPATPLAKPESSIPVMSPPKSETPPPSDSPSPTKPSATSNSQTPSTPPEQPTPIPQMSLLTTP
ncbi:MAG: hypothetical protein EXS12_04965 [Phycisphaerales bacterium]|nr:hypothetical protein [Phycisphaerales bacterium]